MSVKERVGQAQPREALMSKSPVAVLPGFRQSSCQHGDGVQR